MRFDQLQLITQIEKYLKLQSKQFGEKKYKTDEIKKLLEALKMGQCYGLVSLWLMRRKKNEESLFSGTLKLISEWNGKEKTLHENENFLGNLFEQFLNDVRWLHGLSPLPGQDYKRAQDMAMSVESIKTLSKPNLYILAVNTKELPVAPLEPNAFVLFEENGVWHAAFVKNGEWIKDENNQLKTVRMEGGIQIPGIEGGYLGKIAVTKHNIKQIDKIVHTINSGNIIKEHPLIQTEFRLKDNLTKDILLDVLENVAREGKMLLISGLISEQIGHTMGVMKEGGFYYAYDPNDKDYEKKFSSIAELELYIEKSLFKNFNRSSSLKEMPILLDVVDLYPEPDHTPTVYEKHKGEIIGRSLLRTSGIDKKLWENKVPILFAAEYGDLKLIQSMMKHKSDQYTTNENLQNAKMIAAKFGHTHILRELAAEKSFYPFKDQDINGRTALMLATLNGKQEAVQYLINCGENVNVIDNEGRSALLIAIAENKMDIAKLLIANRANLNQKDKRGDNAVLLAASSAKWELVDILVRQKSINLNEQDNNGNTILMVAIVEGKWELAEFLLQQKSIELNKQNKNGKTALDLLDSFPDAPKKDAIKKLFLEHANAEQRENIKTLPPKPNFSPSSADNESDPGTKFKI